MRDLMAQARAAGCAALMFTVDMPVPGSRYRDDRSGLAGAPGLRGAIRRAWQDAIAAAVGDRPTVPADGGARSGSDVMRMLAAKGVLLGRAWACALAGGGRTSVAHMLRLVEAGMRVAMALTGTTTIAAIDRDILVRESRA